MLALAELREIDEIGRNAFALDEFFNLAHPVSWQRRRCRRGKGSHTRSSVFFARSLTADRARAGILSEPRAGRFELVMIISLP